MRNPVLVKRADVYAQNVKVGELVRERQSTLFQYDQSYLDSLPSHQGGVAFHLPYSQRKFELPGDNLHPFFAGLLPEGRRLSTLIASIKTSLDDLFSLLIASGQDCIGDVSIFPNGVKPTPPKSLIDGSHPNKEDFRGMLEKLLTTKSLPHDRTIPGVQDKLSAEMISMPLRDASRRDYILKLNPPRYDLLVQNEAYFMKAAARLGISVAKTKLVADRNGVPGLLVERFDRVTLIGQTHKIHQEDACQFLDRYPADKYRITAGEVGQGIQTYSTAKQVSLLRFIQLCAYSYLIGNHDLHAKNVSLYAPSGGFDIELTPAYDLLSTLPYPHLDQHMPMAIEGKTTNWKAATLIAFGRRFGIPEKASAQMLEKLCSKAQLIADGVPQIGFDQKITEKVQRSILLRATALTPLRD